MTVYLADPKENACFYCEKWLEIPPGYPPPYFCAECQRSQPGDTFWWVILAVAVIVFGGQMLYAFWKWNWPLEKMPF